MANGEQTVATLWPRALRAARKRRVLRRHAIRAYTHSYEQLLARNFAAGVQANHQNAQTALDSRGVSADTPGGDILDGYPAARSTTGLSCAGRSDDDREESDNIAVGVCSPAVGERRDDMVSPAQESAESVTDCRRPQAKPDQRPDPAGCENDRGTLSGGVEMVEAVHGGDRADTPGPTVQQQAELNAGNSAETRSQAIGTMRETEITLAGVATGLLITLGSAIGADCFDARSRAAGKSIQVQALPNPFPPAGSHKQLTASHEVRETTSGRAGLSASKRGDVRPAGGETIFFQRETEQIMEVRQ